MIDGNMKGLWERAGELVFKLEPLDGDSDGYAEWPMGDFREGSLEKGKAALFAALPVNGVVGLEGGFGRAGMGMGADGE